MHPAGRSFKWLATYLEHDAGKAQTSDRVSFVHTLNLAHDDAKSAVDSMLHTYRARHLLKAEAGIRRGGRDVEKPVKHVSLSWHETERPTQAQMIEAARSYLKALGAQDHEVCIWGHQDKTFRHLHLMINMIHPERGTALDTRFERRKAQEWAVAYEKEHGRIFCTERLKPVAERQPSPPRNVWEELRKLQPGPAPERSRAGTIDYDVAPRVWRRQEWEVLKGQQRDERVSFFEDLVGHYRVYRQQIYITTGVTFKPEWRHYFAQERAGVSAERLKALKDDIAARQKAAFQQVVREASPRLREEKDRAYQALLADQKAERARLIDRQERGITSPQLQQRQPMRSAPPFTQAPPTPQAPTPARVPVRPFVWPAKAGMVAQQQTALRWLDRALDRVGRQATPPQPSAGGPRWLQRATDRVQRQEQGRSKEKGSVAAGIEPDGSGGSGL